MTAHRPSAITQTRHTSGGIFGNADNIDIYGGIFTSISSPRSTEEEGFRILRQHVATSAFHNSKQRFDAPRCHEHTREAVLDEILDWIVGSKQDARAKWIAWLNGAAGAGKSAICQSIAELCILRNILVASFFFFRTDMTRNAIDRVVATLAYQIIQLLPETKTFIIKAIEANPLIFEQSFEAQLDLLIVRPLRCLQATGLLWRLLLIIDGVDECSGDDVQMNLLRTMAKLLHSKDLPLIVLFGSRRENQIQMAFNTRNVADILLQLPLDDNYQSEKDIRRFLDDSFDEIKRTHPFSESLASNWPRANHVDDIVQKSSGQFIYASVVVKFLSDPSSNPSTQLDIIRGLRPSGRLTPFAELDALYQHIFSQVRYRLNALNLLAYIIFGEQSRLDIIVHFFQLTKADVQCVLAPLASVVDYNAKENKITFRHASLPDFLRDKGRSGKHCINTLPTRLAILWFKHLESGRFRDLVKVNQNVEIVGLLQHSEINAALHSAIVSYTPSKHSSVFEFPHYFVLRFLDVLCKLDMQDNGKAYRTVTRATLRYVKAEWPKTYQEIEERRDIQRALTEGKRGALTLRIKGWFR